jgi:hypothetical protein
VWRNGPVDPLWWPWSMMRLLETACAWKFLRNDRKISSTHIHVGTPCNPFPLRTNQQTSVQSVIQNNLLRDIFPLQNFHEKSTKNALKFPYFLGEIIWVLILHPTFTINEISTFRYSHNLFTTPRNVKQHWLQRMINAFLCEFNYCTTNSWRYFPLFFSGFAIPQSRLYNFSFF